MHGKIMMRLTIGKMRVICGAISERKKTRATQAYNFNPMIIEYDSINTTFNNLLLPGQWSSDDRKTFLIRDLATKHWFVIEASFTQVSRMLKILIIGTYPESMITDHLTFTDVSTVFYKEDFALQGAPIGCSFFSLRTALKLCGIEKYLPSKMTLFEYLASNATKTEPIHICRLPLRLTLCAQTRTLWMDHVKPGSGPAKITQYSEEEHHLYRSNKKGESALETLKKHITTREDGTSQNALIDHFQNKIMRQEENRITELPAVAPFHNATQRDQSRRPKSCCSIM